MSQVIQEREGLGNRSCEDPVSRVRDDELLERMDLLEARLERLVDLCERQGALEAELEERLARRMEALLTSGSMSAGLPRERVPEGSLHTETGDRKPQSTVRLGVPKAPHIADPESECA